MSGFGRKFGFYLGLSSKEMDCWEFSHGFADNLKWHQWASEESGNHSSQDCPVQEEADGSVSQGAAGMCLTLIHWWSPVLSQSFHPALIFTYLCFWILDILFNFFLFCQVLIKQEIQRKSGYAIQVDEEHLRVQLDTIQSELNAPTQFKVSSNIVAVMKFWEELLPRKSHFYLTPLL